MRHKLNLQRMLPHVSLLLSNIIFWSRHPQRTRTPPWQRADRSSINQPAISHYRSTSLISLTSDILKRSWSFPGIAGALLNAAASGWCVCVSVGVCVFSGCCSAPVASWHCSASGLHFCRLGRLPDSCFGIALRLLFKSSLLLRLPSTPPSFFLSLSLSLSFPLSPSLSLSSSTCACLSSLSLSLSLLTQSWDFF